MKTVREFMGVLSQYDAGMRVAGYHGELFIYEAWVLTGAQDYNELLGIYYGGLFKTEAEALEFQKDKLADLCAEVEIFVNALKIHGETPAPTPFPAAAQSPTNIPALSLLFVPLAGAG